jgi:hypothetical protein
MLTSRSNADVSRCREDSSISFVQLVQYQVVGLALSQWHLLKVNGVSTQQRWIHAAFSFSAVLVKRLDLNMIQTTTNQQAFVRSARTKAD